MVLWAIFFIFYFGFFFGSVAHVIAYYQQFSSMPTTQATNALNQWIAFNIGDHIETSSDSNKVIAAKSIRDVAYNVLQI